MLYLLLADGFEETEAIAPLDMLRRAEIPVKTVGVEEALVTGAHGIAIKADICLEEVSLGEMEGIILPGGMPGTLNLQKNERVQALISACVEKEKLIAAICAAPMILGERGLLQGKRAVCFPGFEEHLEGALLQDEAVAIDGNIITAKGAGAALEFGAALVDYCTAGQGVSSKGARLLSQMQFAHV